LTGDDQEEIWLEPVSLDGQIRLIGEPNSDIAIVVARTNVRNISYGANENAFVHNRRPMAFFL